MTKDELKTRLEAAEKQNLGLLDEIQNLKAQLAEMQDEPEIPDFPIFKPAGEEAWHINNILEVSTLGIASGHVCDFNYFHTEEYAKEFANKCKLIAMMLHCKWYLDRGYEPDWESNSDKYNVGYNHTSKTFSVSNSKRFEDKMVCFSSYENAQKCADWLNAHWKEDGNG